MKEPFYLWPKAVSRRAYDLVITPILRVGTDGIFGDGVRYSCASIDGLSPRLNNWSLGTGRGEFQFVRGFFRLVAQWPSLILLERSKRFGFRALGDPLQ